MPELALLYIVVQRCKRALASLSTERLQTDVRSSGPSASVHCDCSLLLSVIVAHISTGCNAFEFAAENYLHG
jgi:hypothetical protein